MWRLCSSLGIHSTIAIQGHLEFPNTMQIHTWPQLVAQSYHGGSVPWPPSDNMQQGFSMLSRMLMCVLQVIMPALQRLKLPLTAAATSNPRATIWELNIQSQLSTKRQTKSNSSKPHNGEATRYVCSSLYAFFFYKGSVVTWWNTTGSRKCPCNYKTSS